MCKQLEEADQIRRLRRQTIDTPVIYLETGSGVQAAGGERTKIAIEDWLSQTEIQAELVFTGSLGYFSAQPVVGIHLPGRNRLFFSHLQSYEVSSLMQAVFSKQLPREKLIGQWGEKGITEWEGIPFLTDHPWFRDQDRRVMRLNGIIDPGNIQEYLAWGGYQALTRCLQFKTHEEVLDEVKGAGLIGRSGSGYPAYLKWEQVMARPARKRVVICNADESDPGAYMHRTLLEGNPHLVLEGMLIAAYTVGAGEVIFHTRSRYEMVVDRMRKAIDQARKMGLIGTDILGSGYSVEVKVNQGPGAYVTGEETALIASLEGKRGMPRTKPPYPSESGLNGHPTLVHNVETFSQLPLILEKGGDWYRNAGTKNAPGTKLFSLSGKCPQKGVIEVPYGIKLSRVIDQMADPENDKEFKAVLSGGPSGRFILSGDFTISLDPGALLSKGYVTGTGSLVFLDQHSCVVDLVCHLMSFMQDESCGKCIPCREGTRRMTEILQLIISRSDNKKRHEALKRFKGVTELNNLGQVIKQTSLCGLGKGAANPLLSAMENFSEEIEEHVFERYCRAGVCRDLRSFHIDSDLCTGCYVCYNRCPEQAIAGSPRQVHAIIQDKCTGCGICQEVCKFDAVKIN